MNELALLLDEYLATRRALGVKVDVHRSLLKGFVAFAVTHETVFITTEGALQWATEPHGVHPGYWARRLGMVRQFARYAHAVDPRHEVPPQGLLPYSYRRCRPYLYDDTEIAELIAAARTLSGTTGLRPLTYATLLGLLSVTGMRASERTRLSNEPRRVDRRPASVALPILGWKTGSARLAPPELRHSAPICVGTSLSLSCKSRAAVMPSLEVATL